MKINFKDRGLKISGALEIPKEFGRYKGKFIEGYLSNAIANALGDLAHPKHLAELIMLNDYLLEKKRALISNTAVTKAVS